MPDRKSDRNPNLEDRPGLYGLYRPGSRLDDRQIDDLLDDLQVNPDGQELVQKIRCSDPVRSVGSSGSNVCVRFASTKLGHTVECESRNVELLFVLNCEFDPNVLELYGQPESLILDYPGKNGRRVVVPHTPDFLVIAKDRVGFVECKQANELDRLVEERPGRWVREADGTVRCPPAEEAAQAFGLGYRVWSTADVQVARSRNLKFLTDYLKTDPPDPESEQADRVRALVRKRPGIAVEELIDEIGDPNAVYGLVAAHAVHVDLDRYELNDPETRVFPDADSCKAWETAVETVSPLSVHGKNPMTPIDAALKRLASPKAAEEAERRYELIRDVIEGSRSSAQVPGTPPRTVQRWVSAYRKAQIETGCGLDGLYPNWHRGGNRNPRIPEKTVSLMEEVVKEVYEQPVKPTICSAYAVLVGRCPESGVRIPPSMTTFRKFVNGRDPDTRRRKRSGRRSAVANGSFTPDLDPVIDKDGYRPMDVVHIDHTQLDVFVRANRIPGEDTKLKRPWLTLAVCAFSRMVLGCSLSFDPPSYVSCMRLMRDLVQRRGRLPAAVVVDRGADFQSGSFRSFCAWAGIDKMDRPPGQPRYGAVCERTFGTVNTLFLYNLRGNTQNIRDPRKMSADVDPRKQAIWPLQEFQVALERFLFQIHPNLLHSGLRKTPAEQFEWGIRTKGAPVGRERKLDEEFIVHTMPWSKRKKAKVSRQTGIQVDNIRYLPQSIVLDSVVGEKVPVRVDPDNAGRVIAWIEPLGQWVDCLATHYYRAFRGYTRSEAASFHKDLTTRMGRRPTMSELGRFIEECSRKESELQKRLRAEERQALARSNGIRSVADRSGETPDPEAVTSDPESERVEDSAVRSVTPWEKIAPPRRIRI